ncbi:hypothetical protein B6U74_00545 [Candidatus Bathyarchaeota archaeon ex4484_205]|nr:MAG: hypothetical protein B6U74_00545 [Candidatus Bathyarchaeota archaeon ex4484_205]RLG67696.1 MAG: hypothetical protein DRN93_04045 [archaeon]
MSYEYLEDEDLVHEVELLSKQFKAISSQIEKLIALKAKNAVSDPVYRQILDETLRRRQFLEKKFQEVVVAINNRVKKLETEESQIAHELEIIKVKHEIGQLSSTMYEHQSAILQSQLDNLRKMRTNLITFLNEMKSASKKMAQFITQRPTLTPPTSQPPKPSTPPPQPSKTPPSPPTKLTQSQSINIPPISVKKKTSTKKCPKCGAENSPTAAYCTNCGARLI